MTERLGTLTDLDDLPEAVEVTVRHPRVLSLIAWLVITGIVVAALAVFVASSIVTGVASKPGANFSLEEVERRVGMDLPDGSVVVASTASSSGGSSSFAAEIELPGSELPDFALAGYGPVDQGSPELIAELGDDSALVSVYYAASGSKVSGSAALVLRDDHTVLFVDVERSP